MFDLGEFLVDVAISKRRDFLLVRVADRVVVIEMRIPRDENVVYSCAEETRSVEIEESGVLV